MADLDIDAIRARWALFVVAERDLGLGTRRVQDYLYRSDMPNLLAEVDVLHAKVQRVEALTGGPFSAGYRPYAVEIDGDVILTVDLDDLRAALDGSP